MELYEKIKSYSFSTFRNKKKIKKIKKDVLCINISKVTALNNVFQILIVSCALNTVMQYIYLFRFFILPINIIMPNINTATLVTTNIGMIPIMPLL